MVSNKRYAVANMADIFDNVRSYTIGFDRMFDNLNTVSELSNNYPPYNILKLDDEHFVIEIACAGFTKDEFNIHVVPEGNKLVIQGVQDRGEDKRDYYHKGIAARNFTRTFALTDDVEVTNADFENGMLNVSLVRIVPEEKKPKEIKVS
ncbi:MAG: Hsp20 family protein [Cycloclasticus pugetii]